MKVHSVQARPANPHSFRAGEWADVTGVVIVEPDTAGAPPRLCLQLRYPDGAVDYLVANDNAQEVTYRAVQKADPA